MFHLAVPIPTHHLSEAEVGVDVPHNFVQNICVSILTSLIVVFHVQMGVLFTGGYTFVVRFVVAMVP